ncbi:MAG: family 10 glycosylhydrolase [Phycisphaerae bacterium]|nr:family 10 glycosylhydrolase [Phycisphaerae bacterium]
MKANDVVLTLLAFVLPMTSNGQTPPQSGVAGDSLAMKQARKQAVQRRRRIMYNDDGCHERPYKTPDELIALRLKQLIGTQVDTICYCTGGGGLFWGHQPEVGEIIGEFVTDKDAQYVKDICAGLQALKQMGTDPLKVAVEFGHKHGMEVFWSHRMNNIEDSFAGWSRSRWKREHPEYCFGRPEDWAKYAYTDPRKWWAGADYAVPEVREHFLRIFEDVCRRYDVDGIDLDWFRSPRFFRPTTEGRPVTREHVAMMNDFVRKVRAMTEAVALKRGRPILVSCRVPLSVERCLAIGLDIPTWLEEDLVDILVLGGDLAPMAMAPQLREMAGLAHRHGVRVAANIGGSGMQKGQGYTSNEAWWAAAMNAHHAGVDGVYVFNVFPSKPDERFRRIGAVETLRGLDKLYAIDPIEAKNLWGFNRSGLVVPDRLPIELAPTGSATAKLPVGEDIAANAPKGKTAHATLKLRILNVAPDDQLIVGLNDHALGCVGPTAPTTDKTPTAWFELKVDPRLIRAGDNRVDVRLATTRALTQSVSLDRLELAVSYK